MKLGKKLLSLLTVLCLTLSLFPTMALATGETETVSVGSISLSEGQYLVNSAYDPVNDLPSDATGYIYFNASTKALELHNCNRAGGIYKTSGDLKIVLYGTNNITSDSNGINSAGKLTISGAESGSSSLTLTAAKNTTIYAKDTITIQGGAKVTAPCGHDGQSIHLDKDDEEIIITGEDTEVTASNGSNSKAGEIRCGASSYSSNTYTGTIQLNDRAKLTATTINGTLKVNGTVQNNPGSSVTAPSATSGYTVSGRVIDSNSQPIAGASIQLSSSTGTADTSTVIPTSTTAENGTYTFSNIPDGTYTITASKTGYNETSDPTQVTVSDSDVTAQNITLTPINYNIRVQGTQVTGANMNNVLGNSGTPTVTYNPTTKTLTLNNATISSENTQGQGIYASDDLTINLIGTNEITGSRNSIYSTKPLTIMSSENGSLTMSSKDAMSTLYATADITISGSAIVNATIDGNAQAINSDVSGGKITITDTAQVTAKNIHAISDSKAKHSYAVLAGTDNTPNGTIEVGANASLLAQGSTYALRCGTFTYPEGKVKVSTNYSGANPVAYDVKNLSTYKYVEVAPVEEYDVWVGGTQVTSANASNILNDSSTTNTHSVSYEPTTKTLTLTDATITGAPNRQYTSTIKDACGIYSKHDLTIKLIGDNNKVQGAAEQPDGSYGIFVEGRLTFIDGRTDTTGSTPSITVSGGTSNNSGNAWVPGVYASGITVKNCNVTAMGGTASDSYPVAYAMSKAPTLVGAKVVKTNTTNRADGATTTYDKSRITRYQYLQIQKDDSAASVVEAPVIAPEGGYFMGSQDVTITCPTSGATVYYTTDKNSTRTEYTAPIHLSETTTITAIAVKDNQESATVTATFTKRTGDAVTAVTLSLDARDRTLKVGDTSELTATVKHENQTITDINLKVTWESDNPEVATVVDGVITAQSVGKARITAAVVENGVTYSDFCDVIVEARPSSSHHSSSSTTYYDVNAAVSGEGGSVAASTKRASRGTTVTVTATAASGYQVAQVSAVDKDGKAVSLTDKGDGVYTFVMPASKVDVTARFAQVQKPEEKDPYGDVSKDSYYYDAVKWAAETGVTTGVGDGLFAPEWVCTRGQIVTFLWRASGSPAPKATELPFTDVAADAYYAQAVLWAVENGITNGTSETTFSPDQTCTRAHAVAFLYRMSGSPAAAGSTFSDVAADAYYRAAVAWAVEKGITNGTSGTTFSPDDTCTRGQIVTFLYRLAQTK